MAGHAYHYALAAFQFRFIRSLVVVFRIGADVIHGAFLVLVVF